MTLLAVNGGPWRGRGGNRAVTVPKRAPHMAPGSNRPFMAWPCTSLRQGKASPRVKANGRSRADCPSLTLQNSGHTEGSSMRPTEQSPRGKTASTIASCQIPKEGTKIPHAPPTHRHELPLAETRPPSHLASTALLADHNRSH